MGSVTGRITELRKQHTELEEKVEELQRCPGSNSSEIADLKKQKLKIKQEIEKLSERCS
jgi:hypothetical protein